MIRVLLRFDVSRHASPAYASLLIYSHRLAPNNEFIHVPSFCFMAECQGRLSAIRRLTLVLTDQAEHQTSFSQYGRWVSQRKKIIDTWSMFLQEGRSQDRLLNPFVSFPMLEDLTLDFSDWALSDDEEILVLQSTIQQSKHD